MNFERTLTLRVINWPRFCRTIEFTLDADLFPDESAIRQHALNRFGDGRLRRIKDDVWEFERDIAGPQWFWRALAFILNKSYV